MRLRRPDWASTPGAPGRPSCSTPGAATRLGFVPVGTYAETVGPAIDWLVAAQQAGDPDGILPRADDPYFACFFDYEQEDTCLPNLQRG